MNSRDPDRFESPTTADNTMLPDPRLRSLLIWALLLALHTGLCAGWRSFDIDFDEFTYRALDNETLSYCHFELVPYRQHNAVHGSLVVRHQLESFGMRLEITMSRAKSKPYTPLNVTIDGCEFLTSGSSNVNILRIVMDALRDGSSSFPESCPLQPGARVSIEHFFLDPESFPPFLTPTDLQFALGLSAQGHEVFDARVKGRIFTRQAKKRPPRPST